MLSRQHFLQTRYLAFEGLSLWCYLTGDQPTTSHSQCRHSNHYYERPNILKYKDLMNTEDVLLCALNHYPKLRLKSNNIYWSSRPDVSNFGKIPLSKGTNYWTEHRIECSWAVDIPKPYSKSLMKIRWYLLESERRHYDLACRCIKFYVYIYHDKSVAVVIYLTGLLRGLTRQGVVGCSWFHTLTTPNCNTNIRQDRTDRAEISLKY